MTYAWGDETVSGQGIDTRCYPSSTKDERSKTRADEFGRRQQQEHYRRSEKKERKQKNTSISSLPSMQNSSLRSILKPSTSTENLVMSNYLDKRCRIEDVDGNVPPGVQAYWMRDQQLRKSLKRGKKVQFNENSNNSKRKPGKSSKVHDNDDYHMSDEIDSDGRMSARLMKSDEESYCKKRVCTPVASRRAKQHAATDNTVHKSTKNKENASKTFPRTSAKFDHYDGSSSSNYSYSSKEIATSQERPQNVRNPNPNPNPPEAERCMFVRSCVKVAGDPNEDIIAFNELRRQSINRMNAFVRSSGRYSQRGYQAYSSAVNRRINAPTRRSMTGDPYFAADGRDLAAAHGNHVYMPMSSVYANDFARSSLRMSSRGVPKNLPVSGSKAAETVPEGRGTFERSYVRGSRRRRQSVSANKLDGATSRGSTRRQSQRRRTVIGDAMGVPEARESVRRSKHRRDDRGLNGHPRQSMRGPTRNQPEVLPEENHVKSSVTNLSTSCHDPYPSSSSSSPYYVNPTTNVTNEIQEENRVLPVQPVAPPFCRTQQITNNNNIIHQEINVENPYETIPMQPEEEELLVPGGGGVPTVGGETNMQRNIMIPLAEAVVAGAMRRSARQKKRGIAYFTMRKSRGEAVSDLEVISEDQPGRLSPANTDYNEGHWSAPESRTVVKRPVVPPKPPPRLDKIMAQQNPGKPVSTFTGNAYYKAPVPVKASIPVKAPVPVRAPPPNPFACIGRPKRESDDVDDNPISLTDAAQQLEKQFALIARRSPPVMQPSSSSSPSPMPDSAPTPTPSSQLTDDASPDVSKASKSKDNNKSKKPQGKKSKNKRKKKAKKIEEKEEKEAEKKAKKKEEKEKKEKKKDKKKKKKKDKTAKGDATEKKKPTLEGAQESDNANCKPVSKKAPMKPPRKRSSEVANSDYQHSGFDADSVTSEQGHLTVINVVSRSATDNENDQTSESDRYKRKSGLTRLSRKISDRVGTWGKDFKRLLSFRRQKPREDAASTGAENEDSDMNDALENMDETTGDSARRPVVGHMQMNASGAYLPSKSQTKKPLLPPKCTPVPPPNVPIINGDDEDSLNFCDEGKTNQIIYWLQNAHDNQSIEEQLAMLTATTVATQF